ncbi:hypothetical protein BH10ACT3_BH10ACT3_08520 [soil metagenome]
MSDRGDTSIDRVTADLDAEAAVRRVMVAYMAACDAHDADAVADLMHPDVIFEPLIPGTGGGLNGREEVRADYRIACARLTYCVHYLTNERIRVDGDRAEAGWSFFEPATNRGDLAVWTAGRYRHVLTRRDGVWKFAEFRITGVLAAPFATGWVPEHKVPLP